MLQQDIKRTGRASSEERIKKLKARLHSLATRIPVIGLKRVEDVYPALQYNMTIHVTSAITDDTIIDGSNHKRRREASLKQRTSFYITCQRCQKSYIHQESFNTHECKCYTCKICEKSFPYYAFLKRHWSSHSNQRPWRCDKCDKSFKCERDLMQHGRMAHDDNKTCRYCGKIFSRKSSLVNHLKTHNSRHTKGTDVQKATDSKEKQDTDEYRTDSGCYYRND
ncbi:hypothetical protein C0J52_15835 [Blattella germanica]|nr:hypothetical protein C0J52_15835 [Blattella germanica]